MKKIIRTIFAGMLLALAFLMPATGQEADSEISVPGQLSDSYDPLVPQLFAFDNENDVFAGINNVDNTIVLYRKKGNELELIRPAGAPGKYAGYVVDVVEKRHDTHHIYRPKSVAIYDGYVVFLASHRDSCYLAVLDFNANLVKKFVFPGEANAFSYSPSDKELYIAGETITGFDVVILDAKQGINNIDMKQAAAKHYRKPKMSEVIAIEDPWGVGMAAVAMSVVFLSLLLLYLVFKNVGKALIVVQNRKSHKHDSVAQKPAGVLAGDTSGEVYAAISAAIHLYNEELHDEENTVLTINKVSRTYSPWSSKIHGLNTYFNRK
jgi:Na+-transporting methylmalonyl-CoA/oxaloacetate decarboxylase gamma subunit